MLVPAFAHVSRLIAARFQLDLLKSTMLLIARTDAESAKLLSSTVDVLDHAFVRGVSAPDRALAEVIAAAEVEGRSGAEIEPAPGRSPSADGYVLSVLVARNATPGRWRYVNALESFV